MPKQPGRNEKGFTLIEILIAVGIASLVAAAGAGAIVQVVRSADTTAHMLAVRQVQQAGYWLSTDVLQSQNVTAPEPTGFPLALTWNGHNITYTLEPMDDLQELQRSDGTTNITVAKYLTDNTSCSWIASANGTTGRLTFTVEASVLGARGAETEERTYEVKPRPG